MGTIGLFVKKLPFAFPSGLEYIGTVAHLESHVRESWTRCSGIAEYQLSKELSRRTFLKETVFGALSLTAARWIPASASTLVLPDETARQLKYFSTHEYLVVGAIAERIVGPPGKNGIDASHVDVALRADRFLAGADTEIQEQFHQLLTVFNAPFFTFLFDFRFSSFLNMTPEDKDSYLEDWMTSVIGFRRQGFQALKRICLSMFYTDSRTWAESGFDGVFFPSEA